MSIYLDHAAATPLDERVFAVMEPYFRDLFYNPSGLTEASRQVRRDYEEARHRLAMVLGARSSEVILTAGATESIALAIHGVLRATSGHVVTTATEHPAVLTTAREYDHTLVEVDERGAVDPAAVAAAVRDDTVLVSVQYANNELGTVQQLRAIADEVARIRETRTVRGLKTPLWLHTDAAQAANYLDLSVARLGIDLMSVSAAKCYGPKQVALLWARSDVQLAPLWIGGGQERGLRGGTENVAGAVGFATALEIAAEMRKTEAKRVSDLRDHLQQELETIGGLVVNGHPTRRLPNFLHVAIDGLDAERTIIALDLAGVIAATGSACSANKQTRSHVLEAVGMPPSLADGSLRLTLGRLTDEEGVAEAAETIQRVVAQERQR